MPRGQTISTLGYAILGLLARGDASGYDLTGGMKEPVGFFWNAQHSQIYPELARLEGLGLVAHTVVTQDDRPDKKVYTLQPAGRSALTTWLTAPMEVPTKRDELVLRAYSIWLADPAAAARLVREHARAHAHAREHFEHKLKTLEAREGKAIWQVDSPWFGAHAALRRGIGFEREYETWCDWLAGCLEASAG
jgi:DNA-binding PadR family transcriptional regulator